VRHDPPTAGELADASRAVDDALRRLPAARPNHVVLTGGTATHVALIAGSTDQSVRLESTALDRIAVALAALPAGAIVDAYHVDPQRARVLPVGAVELKTVARFYAATSVVITRHGIREGVIIEERESAKDGPADG
jgi:exopolyphosphatase/pppGpp-phosphohydrolase